MSGGQEVTGQVTLGLCGGRYPSEALRTARLQVAFLDRADRIGASNEIVSYRPGGATQAYRELRTAARHCPRTYQEHGATVSHIRIGPLDPRLLRRQLVVSVLFSQGTNRGHVWSAAVYGFQDDYFSGVYVYGHSRDQALHVALRLATISAGKLRSAVS